MSNHPSTRKTLAQLRAEKEERNHQLRLGIQHTVELSHAHERYHSERALGRIRHDEWNAQ